MMVLRYVEGVGYIVYRITLLKSNVYRGTPRGLEWVGQIVEGHTTRDLGEDMGWSRAVSGPATWRVCLCCHD